MPKWEIHNKWSDKMGISQEISNFVNNLIDSPPEKQCEEFKVFLDLYKKRSEKMKEGGRRKVITEPLIRTVGGHDAGRRRKTAAYIQLEFLRPKGSESNRRIFNQDLRSSEIYGRI